jgi:hypothetical protein
MMSDDPSGEELRRRLERSGLLDPAAQQRFVRLAEQLVKAQTSDAMNRMVENQRKRLAEVSAAALTQMAERQRRQVEAIAANFATSPQVAQMIASTRVNLDAYMRIQAQQGAMAAAATKAAERMTVSIAASANAAALADRMMKAQSESVAKMVAQFTNGQFASLLRDLDKSRSSSARDLADRLGIDLDVVAEAVDAVDLSEPPLGDDEGTLLYDDEFIDELSRAVTDVLEPGVDALAALTYVLTLMMLLTWWATFLIAVPGAQFATSLLGGLNVKNMHAIALKVSERTSTGWAPEEESES